MAHPYALCVYGALCGCLGVSLALFSAYLMISGHELHKLDVRDSSLGVALHALQHMSQRFHGYWGAKHLRNAAYRQSSIDYWLLQALLNHVCLLPVMPVFLLFA